MKIGDRIISPVVDMPWMVWVRTVTAIDGDIITFKREMELRDEVKNDS